MDALSMEKIDNTYLVMVDAGVWAGYDALTMELVFAMEAFSRVPEVVTPSRVQWPLASIGMRRSTDQDLLLTVPVSRS